jgi:polyhydroxybutyrate depolymerase
LTLLRGNDGALGPVAVDFATSDVTAMAGEDYTAASGTLEFQAGETVKTLSIPVLPDAVAESTENFRVTLSNPTGDATLGTATTRVSIQENDCTVAPPFASRLAIERNSDVHILTWTGGGKMQRADQVTGPWQTLTATQGPYNVMPQTAATFYRVAPPRPAKLYVPSSYNGQTPMPLVLLLHGAGQTGQLVEDYIQLRPLAEARGFLYCYPDATVDPWGTRHWSEPDEGLDPSSDLGLPVVDDPGYLRDVIEETARRFALDRKRVYLIGHSSGGFMCYRMACEYAGLIAGIASLGGTQAVDASLCTPSEPVHILDIRGTADEQGAYWGVALGIAAGYPVNLHHVPGAMRIVQIWAGYNGASDPVTDLSPTIDLALDVPGLDTVVTRYIRHPSGGAVELWTINNGLHSPMLSPEFSPKVIDWLLAHPKP